MGLPLAVGIGLPVCTNDLPFLVPSVDGSGRVYQLALVGLMMDEKKCIVQMGVVVTVSSLTKSQ